jgi:hypothetical protein
MEYVGVKPTELPDLLKVLEQIAVKVPRFPSETEGFHGEQCTLGKDLPFTLLCFH